VTQFHGSCSFPNTAPAPEKGVGGKERTGRPAGRGGPHPQGRNKEEDLSEAQVTARRGGPRGERRPLPLTAAGERRYRASDDRQAGRSPAIR